MKKITLAFALIFILIIFSFRIGKSKNIIKEAGLTNTATAILSEPIIENPLPKSPEIIIGNSRILVELATTTAKINKGLSGRPSLNPNSGMLFVFNKAMKYRFWMPDMHFPLDLIWINNGKIVDISANVTNDFDPVNPTFYTPKSPTQYVLEVNANFCKKNGIKIGDKVSFENIELNP